MGNGIKGKEVDWLGIEKKVVENWGEKKEERKREGRNWERSSWWHTERKHWYSDWVACNQFRTRNQRFTNWRNEERSEQENLKWDE